MPVATPSRSADAAATRGRDLFPLPLVGRDAELASLTRWLDEAAAGRGGTMIVGGAGGVGKTRLVSAAAEHASRHGWAVTTGRAYPVETGVPYAVFADALLPVLRATTPGALAVLTRGDGGTLAHICPAFAAGGAAPRDGGADAKARLLWSFSQFLVRLAASRPLLVVLENLQWADTSSLELLHFVARQIGGERVALLCTYNENELDANPTLRTTEQSLLSLGAARLTRLDPLDAEALEALVRQAFHADPASARALAGRLYSWTRGNPFFAQEMLKALVESRALHERDGAWHGWEADPPGLPRSIRDAVVARANRLSPTARAVANLAAVIGTRTSHDALVAVSGLAESEVLAALDELRAARVLAEEVEGGTVRYEFTHPLVRDVLYGELGIARARLLHATVAEALEALYGPRAPARADELAYHFSRAESRGLVTKAVRYLAAAGRDALARYANREAANYMSAALEQLDEAGETAGEAPGGVDADALVEDLAQVRQRLGDYQGATALWTRARAAAERRGDPARVAAIERRMGLGSFWSGRYQEALAHLDAALGAAARAADDSLHARVRVARAMTVAALGQPEAARAEVAQALEIADRLGDPAVLARVHRSSLLLHLFIGPAERAHADGLQAIAFAEAAGERGVAWSAHWAMAVVGGLTGHASEMAHHMAEGDRLADALGSPVLRCWMAEVAIEYSSGTGEWEAGLALAERTIPMARALGQRVLLPRLLVWTAMLHLNRGAPERAKAYLDEAWQLCADRGGKRPADIHSLVPVHAGLVAYHVAMGEHRRAIEIGDAGLAMVDRTGYVAWGIHRLLPMMIEAALWLGDIATAERYRDRLRRDSHQIGHRLGIAWADTCDALIEMLAGKDHDRAATMLRRGADALEAVPWVLDASRVRRKLAWVLAKTGDREGAARELRQAHDQFVRLGAERELDETRELFRELGLRPPPRAGAPAGGAGELTEREVDVVRLVAEHRSNKEIAAALGISPRTVSTHLSNVFVKLGVDSRSELADVARRRRLVEE